MSEAAVCSTLKAAVDDWTAHVERRLFNRIASLRIHLASLFERKPDHGFRRLSWERRSRRRNAWRGSLQTTLCSRASTFRQDHGRRTRFLRPAGDVDGVAKSQYAGKPLIARPSTRSPFKTGAQRRRGIGNLIAWKNLATSGHRSLCLFPSASSKEPHQNIHSQWHELDVPAAHIHRVRR
jgi:hypothetical protein